jgi:uncharacterized protein (DUF169 family)
MSPRQRDYSVFDRFNFTRKPVGIKYVALKPDGISRITRHINLCEMVKEAQTSPPFYAQREDFECVEPILLGMEDAEPTYVSGLVGARGGVYREARANRRIYQELPCLPKGSVRCVVVSPVDQMTFDPDVLTITADNTAQAQILLRAISYSSGEVWHSRLTPVAACSWMFIYPVLSGNCNYTATGLSMGMKILKVFPEGLFLFSIPWDKLPGFVENLEDMEWDLELGAETRDEAWRIICQGHEELTQELAKD